MPKVKEKSLLREVEEEIARLSDDHGGGGDSPDFPQSGMRDMMQLQQQQHTELLQALSKSQQDTCSAMVSAMKELVNTQQKQGPLAQSSQKAPISQQSPAPISTQQAPHGSQQPQNPPMEEEYEDDDDETSSFIDDADFDFSGWDLPQSGQVAEITEPIVHKPGPSSAPDASESPSVATTPVLNAELFNDYEDQPNWNPPADLFY